ncbi:hypothetical protein JW960_16385 [candidate division KSB1 bacterium]|nr:hypothetical protein [candidate division KSB1 bacterium]
MNDKQFVDTILAHDESAWHQFVDQFTDSVFSLAKRWTQRETLKADKHQTRQFTNPVTGEISDYNDDTVEAYLWLFEQLRNKLASFEGIISLEKFVWSKLNSPNLFKDYLVHKYGKPNTIPKVLEHASDDVRNVFVLWRMKKSDEQILYKLRTKHQVELKLEELWNIKNEILVMLSEAGLQDLVIPGMNIELNQQLMSNFSVSPDANQEDSTLLYLSLLDCLKKLDREEQHLLNLFYDNEFTASEILELYQQTEKKFLNRIDSNKLKAKTFYNYRERLIGELRTCMEIEPQQKGSVG